MGTLSSSDILITEVSMLSLASLSLFVMLQAQPVLHESDFESGAEGWDFSHPDLIRVEDTGDAERGRALRLRPGGPGVHALLAGSEEWGAVRVDGVVMFPRQVHNYLGLIWGFQPGPHRTDFAGAYIKGNGSYIRVNPSHDGNPLRNLHEELRVPLEGDDAVEIGRWQPFRVEIEGVRAHVYFGDLDVPKVTYDLYMGHTGAIGFKPRVIGGDVWIDDIRVTALADGLSYDGPPRPRVDYGTTGLLTDWWILGPAAAPHPHVPRATDPLSVTASEGGHLLEWEPVSTDERGAVITSRAVQFRGPATRAYFATRFEVEAGGADAVFMTSIDDLAIWVDGEFRGYYRRDRFAWHDFLRNPEHAGLQVTGALEPGEHWLVVEVMGALYAGGGFFAGLAPTP